MWPWEGAVVSEVESDYDVSSAFPSPSLVPSLSPDEAALLRMKLDNAEEHIEQLERAMASRVIVGQAQGLLMERMGLDSDQAIAYLKRASMNLNLKLVNIADEIVRTRQLPRFD